MRNIILDGSFMTNKRMTHINIKFHLKSRQYYGNNLDALWDVLSTYSCSIKISLINKDKLIENLGEYGESLIKVFKDGAEENDKIDFEIL